MAIKKRELLEEIAHKRIDFLGPDGKPDGRFLDIDYRRRAMPYGKKKALMDSALGIQGSVKRIETINKKLENKSLSDVERERFEAERHAILVEVNQLTEPLVDYLGGIENQGPDGQTVVVRPPAIVNWDLLGDDDQPVPINRAEIEDLDEATLSFIAWQLLNGADVGEAKGTNSQQS